MKILRFAALGLVGLVVLLVAASLALPKTARVERSRVVAAHPETVFTVLNGFRQFNRWSPWADMDPAATYAFEGPPTGVGARMSWKGNDAVGSGSQEIVQSEPYRRIRVKLDFAGFEGTENLATYTVVAEGEGTRVSWALDMDARGSLMARWFGLFLDGMVGPDYDKGLERLEALAESLPKTAFANLPIEVADIAPIPIAFVSTSSATDDRALGVAQGYAYGRVSAFLNARGLTQAGPPVAVFQPVENGVLRFDAGLPVDRADVEPVPGLRFGQTFAGLGVKAVHRGPYAMLPMAHAQITAFLAAAGYVRNGASVEQYVSDPSSTPDAGLVTNIYVPVK